MKHFTMILSTITCILSDYKTIAFDQLFDEVTQCFDNIVNGMYGNKTAPKLDVAAIIAAYGGYWVGAFKPAIVGDLLCSPDLVVYKGMIYSRDIWE